MPDYKEILEASENLEDAKIPPSLMSRTDVNTVREYVSAHPKDKDIAKLNHMIQTNDFSRFEELPAGLIHYYSSALIYARLDNREKTGEPFSPAEEGERKVNSEQKTNPFYRAGLDMASNTPSLSKKMREDCAAMGVAANEEIMKDTLSPATLTQVGNLLNCVDPSTKRPATIPSVQARLRQDRLTQITLAKTLFLAQLGDFHVTQAKSGSQPYGGSVTEALAHGGRTIFTLGKGRAAAENTIRQSVFHDSGKDFDNGTSVQKRVFATHGMTVKSGGADPAHYKETNPLTSVTNNYMMNPAIGGLGNQINNGKTIFNNGNNGHVYLKMVESTAKEGGYLMLGVEAEEGGSVGALGHHHTALATPAKMSAFTAPKGGPGAKTGGRIVDLSAWDPDTLGAVTNAFGAEYSRLSRIIDTFNTSMIDRIQIAPEEPGQVREAREKLSRIHEKLCGKVMEPTEMLDFMKTDLGITHVERTGSGGIRESVSVEELMRQRVQHRGFEKLDSRAKARIPETAEAKEKLDLLMQTKDFTLSQSFENLAKGLDHNKKKILGLNSFFGIKRRDSGEMKRVKAAMRKVIDVSRKGSRANAYESREALNGLIDAAEAYLGDENKDHSSVRSEIVRRIREMAKSEHGAVKKVELDIRIREGMPLRHYEVRDSMKEMILGVSREALAEKARQHGLHENQIENLNRLYDSAGQKLGKLIRDVRDNPVVRGFDGAKEIVAFQIIKDKLLGEEKDPRVGGWLESGENLRNFTDQVVNKMPGVKNLDKGNGGYLSSEEYISHLLNVNGLKKLSGNCLKGIDQCSKNAEALLAQGVKPEIESKPNQPAPQIRPDSPQIHQEEPAFGLPGNS